MSESKDQTEDKNTVKTRHGDFKFAWGFDGEDTRIVILVDANLR